MLKYNKICIKFFKIEGMMPMGAIFNTITALWNQILYAVSNIRFFDVVDILIIAFIIYKAIQFLRETRAGQLVKGILFLLILYAFAIVFELAVLRWLLSAIVGSAIVALAIVFQPELRRILERVGQVKLGHSQTTDSEVAIVLESIDKICKAAGTMQENKIGALIVFERKTQLGEIINTGTVVDARVSVSMMNNIFFPKSPLHDGAVIIRDGRVYAAGCILPLAQDANLSSQLGTRHRAAVGMTENSDAIVLVVSEETGTISIAYDGTITRNYSVATAYEELKSKLVSEDIDAKDTVILSALKRLFPFSLNKKSKEGEEKNEN